MAEGPSDGSSTVHDATRLLEVTLPTNSPETARLKRRSTGALPMQGPPLPPPDYPPPPLPASAQSSNLDHNVQLATRRPARSSPLAGPSLNRDGTSVPELKGTDHPQTPTSLPGTLDIGSSPTKSILHRERVKSTQGPQKPASADNAATSSKRQSPSRRVSFVAASIERKAAERRSEDLPRRPIMQFFADPSVPVPPLSDKVLRSAKSAQSLRSYQSPSTTPPKGKSHSLANGLPAQRRSSESENWLISNPYDVTPQFTRLGLGAEGVVLPVPARKRKNSNSVQKGDSEKPLRRKSSSSSAKSVASTFVAALTRRTSQIVPSPPTPQMTSLSSASASSISLPTPTGPFSNATSRTSSSDSIAFLPAKMLDASTADLSATDRRASGLHFQDSSGTTDEDPSPSPPHIFQRNSRIRTTSMGALLGRSASKPRVQPAERPHAHTWGVGSFRKIRRPHTANSQSPIPSYMKTPSFGFEEATSGAPTGTAPPTNVTIDTTGTPTASLGHTRLRSSSKTLSLFSFGSTPRDSSDSSREMVSHLPFSLTINTTPSNLAHVDVAPDSPLLGKPSGSFVRTPADSELSSPPNDVPVTLNGGRPVKMKKTGTVKRLWRSLTSAKKPPSPQSTSGAPTS